MRHRTKEENNTIKLDEYKMKPAQELLQYSSNQLRHAANWADRNKGIYQPLSVIAMIKKLNDLNATLEIEPADNIYDSPDCYGSFSFYNNIKEDDTIRDFTSATELSIALSLGPVDLYWEDNLFFKTSNMCHPCHTIEDDNIDDNDIDNTGNINIYIPNLDEYKLIILSGAEKVLCNTDKFLTAGRVQLNYLANIADGNK